jgi:hypothetical protein
MDAQDVLEVLQALNKKTGMRHILGVYPLDMLPELTHKPAAIVANTSDSSQQSGHWVAFYIPEEGSTQYFDSYGTIPLHPEFYTWLQKFNMHKELFYNKKRYQANNSPVCGFYSLVFLARRMGLPCSRELTFNKDFKNNDKKIKASFKTLCKFLKVLPSPRTSE